MRKHGDESDSATGGLWLRILLQCKGLTTEDTEFHGLFYYPVFFCVLCVEELKLKVLAEFGEAANDEQLLLRRSRVDLLVLQYPGVAVGHENGVQPGGEGGIDVGFRAVADHPRRGVRKIVFLN